MQPVKLPPPTPEATPSSIPEPTPSSIPEPTPSSIPPPINQPTVRLTNYAKWWEAERNIRVDEEAIILRDKAVMIALMNLDMRFRTYADESWTAEVIQYVTEDLTTKLDSPQYELWLQRENDIIAEVHFQMDILHTKRGSK